MSATSQPPAAPTPAPAPPVALGRAAGSPPVLRRILIPLDGSPRSLAIVPQVRRLLVRPGAEVRLLRVVERGPAGPLDFETRRRIEDSTAELRAVRDVLVGDGIAAAWDVRAGAPAEGILQVAEEWRASLVAMSTHGRTGLSRVLRGSVAESVLRASRVPVLLANPSRAAAAAGRAPRLGSGQGEVPLRRILVALDGSEAAARVLPLAEEAARAFGAEVVLVHAVGLFGEASPILTEGGGVEGANAYLARLARALVDRGVRARSLLPAGDPAAAILRAAREEGAELIALTTHGRSGLARALFGSVAEEVLRGAAAPVLVLRTVG
ncbi:MAG: universal stress protein [Planctomycetales bacterium]|nr:universal stress protein [Planctomycetales bacterium]